MSPLFALESSQAASSTFFCISSFWCWYSIIPASLSVVAPAPLTEISTGHEMSNSHGMFSLSSSSGSSPSLVIQNLPYGSQLMEGLVSAGGPLGWRDDGPGGGATSTSVGPRGNGPLPSMDWMVAIISGTNFAEVG